MKKILLSLFFSIFLGVAFGQLSQFRMIGSGSWTTVNDSTFSSTVTIQSDLTSNGFLPTGITDSMLVFTQTGQRYRISSATNLTFSSADLSIVERGGDWGIPVGQVMIYEDNGRSAVPSIPFGATGATAKMQEAIDTYNSIYTLSANELADSTSAIRNDFPSGGGASSFTDLTDSPNSYTGQANKMVLVNPGETGLIFADTSAGGGSSELGQSSFYTKKEVDAYLGTGDANRNDKSSVVRVGADSLFIAYASGGASDFSSFRILSRLSTDGGTTWGDSSVVFDSTHPGLPNVSGSVQNPNMYYENDTIHLVFVGNQSSVEPFDLDIYYSRSLDKGVTWSSPSGVLENSEYAFPIMDRLIRTNTNRLLIPYTQAVDNTTTPNVTSCADYHSYVAYSDDAGDTWTTSIIDAGFTGPFEGEPGIVQLPDNSLLLYIRTCQDWVEGSRSIDDGTTWSKPFRMFKGTNSTTSIKIIPDLNNLMVASNNKFRVDQDGAHDTQTDRYSMYLSVSYDLGTSWKDIIIFHSEEEQNAYEPTLFYDVDNSELEVFYTWAKITSGLPEDLMQVTIPKQILLGFSDQHVFNEIFPRAIHLNEYSYSREPTSVLQMTFDTTINTPYDEQIEIVKGSAYQRFGNRSSLTADYRPSITAYTPHASTPVFEFRILDNPNSTLGGIDFNFLSTQSATDYPTSESIFTINNRLTELFDMKGDGSVVMAGPLDVTSGFENIEVFPTSSASGQGLEIKREGVSGGHLRLATGTGSSSVYWPYLEAQPLGSYATRFRFKQTASSSTLDVLDFQFTTSASGTIPGDIILMNWDNNATNLANLRSTGVLSTSTGYRINNAATSGEYLRGDGTNFVSSSIQESDLPNRSAVDVSIVDVGAYYVATETEAVLQEIGAKLNSKSHAQLAQVVTFNGNTNDRIDTISIDDSWNILSRPENFAVIDTTTGDWDADSLAVGKLIYLGLTTKKFRVSYSFSGEMLSTADATWVGALKNGTSLNHTVKKIWFENISPRDYANTFIVELATNDTLDFRFLDDTGTAQTVYLYSWNISASEL